ncbi:hypothetical protein [Microlunatus elymi]|nr:hypothetical protein [Microlunatus elymi]
MPITAGSQAGRRLDQDHLTASAQHDQQQHDQQQHDQLQAMINKE